MSNRRRLLDNETSRITGELSERSGVAKSIISQIESNETNPTLSTLRKLARALNAPIKDILWRGAGPALVERVAFDEVPSQLTVTGSCRLNELSWEKLAGAVTWRHLEIEPDGAVEAAAHPLGVVGRQGARTS